MRLTPGCSRFPAHGSPAAPPSPQVLKIGLAALKRCHEFEWSEATVKLINSKAVTYQTDSKLIQAIRDKRKWMKDKGSIITSMVKRQELDVLLD